MPLMANSASSIAWASCACKGWAAQASSGRLPSSTAAQTRSRVAILLTEKPAARSCSGVSAASAAASGWQSMPLLCCTAAAAIRRLRSAMAAATLICWPVMAQTSASNGLLLAGTRKPIWPSSKGPSTGCLPCCSASWSAPSPRPSMRASIASSAAGSLPVGAVPSTAKLATARDAPSTISSCSSAGCPCQTKPLLTRNPSTFSDACKASRACRASMSCGR